MADAEAIKELRGITDPAEYFRALGKYKEKYLICVAVKDTFFQIPAETAKVLVDLGMEDLHLPGELGKVAPRGWQGYLFVMNKGQILLNKRAKPQMSLIEDLETDGISMRLVSKPYHSGDMAKIILDGYDLSVNKRGLNVVVFDIEGRGIIDSVSFDFYQPEKNRKICTRRKNFLEISLPDFPVGDLYKEDGNAVDIDDELDSIIVKYQLDEYYPRYTYRRRAMKAIRALADTWERHENVACVIVWKNYQNAIKDRDYFLSGISEKQKDQVSFIFVQFKGGAAVNSYSLSGKCLDYAVLERTSWKSFDHVYILSNIGDNYLGLWFRQRNVAYINLYKYLESHGIVGIGANETYYNFITDKREFCFSDRTTECSPIYWEIYEEKEQYMASKALEMQLTSAKKIFFLALAIRDFIFAKEWLDNICCTTEKNEKYKCAWNEIQTLLDIIKRQLKMRKQRDFLSIWIDQVQYSVALEHMPFIASLREKSIWFDNAFNIVAFTRETLRTLYTGKRLIEDSTNDFSNLDILTSPLMNRLLSSGYCMHVYGGYHQELFPEVIKPHNHFYFSNPSSDMLWTVLRNLIKNPNRCYAHVHILGEVHEPYVNIGMCDGNLPTWLKRKYLGCESVDKQIKFYLDLIGKNITSIIFSDHGQHYFGVQNHVLFLVYGNMYRSRRIPSIFSLLDFGKLVIQILKNGDVQEKELQREFAEIQGTTILRGGKFPPKAGIVQEAVPEIYPIFRGYRGIVTKDYIYVHVAGGREWLSKKSHLQPRLSWYERSDDICDKTLLEDMRKKAHVNYGHEPSDYGNQSEYYLSLQQKIDENQKYNGRKIFLANGLLSRVADKSVVLYGENLASRELFLMLSLENRKKIVGVMDNAPKTVQIRQITVYPCADLGLSVFPLSEAVQRGVRYIITTSRTEEEELKKFVSESNHPFHVYGLYGWFALCGYHTKYNFWDFVIESMDEKPASELSIPYFLHHASPKAASVAAVIVTQNDEACIAPCLHRFLGEVTTGVEIYCVDLSSTDKTVEIIQGYGKIDSSIHVTVVKQEELWGKLTELLASMGEKYVAFFSPRDILHPRAVSYLHGAAEAAGADVVASCAVLPSSEEGKALEKNIREGELALKLEVDFVSMVYPARYEEALSQAPSLFHGARLYRTGFLRENKIRLSDAGDGMFFLKVMFQTAKYARTAEPVCVSESARHGGMQERFRECYERNRKAVNGYRLWHHALPLLPEYGEQPVMPIPLGSGRYAYLNRNEKKINQVFEIRRTDKVEKSFFRDLSRPIIVVGEMNLRHWEHLYQNLAKSEDFGADNHVYLCYNTLDEFLLLLQVEDISPYLAEEKFVFLFGQRDVAENYPLDFENIYHETYRQEGNVPILRRILPGDHWQGLADKEFQAWLDKSARGILASREFEMSDLSRLYAIYEDVAVGK